MVGPAPGGDGGWHATDIAYPSRKDLLMMRVLSRTGPVALVAIMLAGCSLATGTPSRSDSAPPPGDYDVAVTDMRFEPASLEVEAGTTVTWLFDDGSVRHDVVGDGWGSEVERDGTFTHTFDEPGTYAYDCTLHRGMTGEVVVTAG